MDAYKIIIPEIDADLSSEYVIPKEIDLDRVGGISMSDQDEVGIDKDVQNQKITSPFD